MKYLTLIKSIELFHDGMILMVQAVKGAGGFWHDRRTKRPCLAATGPRHEPETSVWRDAQFDKNGLRQSGNEIWDWDDLHNDIEVYDGRGRHLGSRNPTTGEMYKPAVPGRRINL